MDISPGEYGAKSNDPDFPLIQEMLSVSSYRFLKKAHIYIERIFLEECGVVENRRGRGSQSIRGKRSRLDPYDSSDEIKRGKNSHAEDDGSREGRQKRRDVKDEDEDNATSMAAHRDLYRNVV